MAADKNFKTFQAAYPYVVRKLLTENTLETRRILYSVKALVKQLTLGKKTLVIHHEGEGPQFIMLIVNC